MYPQFLEEDDPEERQLGIDMGLVLLSKCHELWVFGNRISSGMSVEIAEQRDGIYPSDILQMSVKKQRCQQMMEALFCI